jgi:ceramide glucosyltransferase
MRTLEIVAAVGTLASLAYYFVCLWSAASFQKAELSSKSFRPRVSILKPLKGTDPDMYESFRSHCVQEYSEYEIIFGLNDPVDPAIELVERLKKEFPQHQIRLIFCPEILGTNTKVSNLAQMLRQARYDHIIVNDSDIRVPANYLSGVLTPLANPDIGLVTCLYRGIANHTLGSQLESLGISTDFAPGVLVARQLEGIRFGLGSTLVFRRRDLDSIGGFQSVVDYLADDYQLGNRIVQQGLKGQLSETIVETFLPEYSFADFLSHQIRWGRTVRDSRLGGYIGLIFTFGIPWALLAIIFSRGTLWSWGLLALTFAVRAWVALRVGKSVLQDPQVVRFLYLLPLRDILAALIWIMSFTGHTIDWRGDKFYLRRGKLEPITTKTEST